MERVTVFGVSIAVLGSVMFLSGLLSVSCLNIAAENQVLYRLYQSNREKKIKLKDFFSRKI